MADFFAVQTDPKKRDDGVRFLYRGDIVLIIRSAESPDFKEAALRIWKTFKADGDKATEEEIRSVNERIFAEALLIGWENLQIHGEDVPFSKAKALELLRIREANLFEFVNEAASDRDHFARGQIESAAGN